MLIVPLVMLGMAAAYVSGQGLAGAWYVPFPCQYVVAGALHASYALRSPKTRGFLCTVSWCTCLYFTWAGMTTLGSRYPFLPAAVLETVCLLLSASNAKWVSISERLAAWRQTQSQIAVQLRMSEGLLPWVSRCAHQVVVGTPESSEGHEHLRLAAILADSENRLRARIARVALPEQIRQSILTNASRIVARAETSAATRSIEVEQLILEAMAACRDDCSQLEDLSAAERGALTKECERAFMELAHH